MIEHANNGRAFEEGLGPESAVKVTARTEEIRGLRVTNAHFREIVAQIVSWACSSNHGRYFACVNPHSAELAQKDTEFRVALNDADILVPDGIGVVLASRVLGGKIRSRVTGPEIFQAVSLSLNDLGGKSVFYLGGNEATLRVIEKRHMQMFPTLAIAGTYSPPFKPAFSPDDMTAMIHHVNAASPDVLWVGLGAPKQEKWVHEARKRLRVPLCGPVGALFDYFSGNLRHPPAWMAKSGMQWAHRLALEPRRMWPRVISMNKFISNILADCVRRRGDRSTN